MAQWMGQQTLGQNVWGSIPIAIAEVSGKFLIHIGW